MKIDWEDLLRIASDPDLTEEFQDLIWPLIEKPGLSETDLENLWNTFVAHAETAEDDYLWGLHEGMEVEIALKIFFSENSSDSLWQKLRNEIAWADPGFQTNFFSELPKHNPGSKLILFILESWPDLGEIKEVVDNLKKCKYFNEKMLSN